MIKLNINEKKRLKFNIRVSGVMPQDLRGSMKIMMEKVEYGFPIKVDEGKVIVDISPLSEITSREFSDGQTFDAQLDIIAAETFTTPWKDKIKIESPLKIEAMLSELEEVDEEEKKLEISVEGIDEEEKVDEARHDKKDSKKDEKKKKEKRNERIKSRFGKLLEK